MRDGRGMIKQSEGKEGSSWKIKNVKLLPSLKARADRGELENTFTNNEY
jgi:hypothetical protein